MALMSDRCQSNGNDHLLLLKINVSCYMIKLGFDLLTPCWKIVPERLFRTQIYDTKGPKHGENDLHKCAWEMPLARRYTGWLRRYRANDNRSKSKVKQSKDDARGERPKPIRLNDWNHYTKIFDNIDKHFPVTVLFSRKPIPGVLKTCAVYSWMCQNYLHCSIKLANSSKYHNVKM